MRRYAQPFTIYVFPLILTAIAGFVSPLTSKPGTPPLFLFFFLAVLASSYLGKPVSGGIATIASAAVAARYLAAPVNSFSVASTDDIIRFVAFFVSSAIGIVIIQRLQKAVYREQLLRMLVDASPALTVLADKNGRISMFNAHCEEVTGYKREEVIGRTIAEMFLTPEWQQAVRERFENVETVLKPHENPWRTKTGEFRHIEWVCREIKRSMEPSLVLGLGRDVTDEKQRKLLERELERLSAKTELANELAHELNNPLQALTNVFTLLMSNDANEHARAYREHVQEHLDRVTEVSRKLLRVTSDPNESLTTRSGSVSLS